MNGEAGWEPLTMRELTVHLFGHSRIAGKIGAGEMGGVYGAHDERVDRDVAIKVLLEDAYCPSLYTASPEPWSTVLV